MLSIVNNSYDFHSEIRNVTRIGNAALSSKPDLSILIDTPILESLPANFFSNISLILNSLSAQFILKNYKITIFNYYYLLL